jgi:hypothetical protein
VDRQTESAIYFLCILYRKYKIITERPVKIPAYNEKVNACKSNPYILQFWS